MSEAPSINCDEPGWGFKLLSLLAHYQEVNLTNCDFNLYSRVCEGTAERFGMALNYDPENRILRFERKSRQNAE